MSANRTFPTPIQRYRQIRLRTRLTILVFITTLPLLAGITLFITSRAGAIITQQADRILADANSALASKVSTWLELQVRALDELARLPDIVSMNPVQQKPVLETMSLAYPNLFLVQTTNLVGINVARNDSLEPKDYHDRLWYQGARSGAPITFEVLISRTTGKPALNMATPIRNTSGEIIGVASIVSELDEVSREVIDTSLGQEGYTYIVDPNNRVVAHPDPTFTEQELRDLSDYSPVVALRNGTRGLIAFTDNNGVRWRAYVNVLDNNWGIIAQQPESEVLASLRLYQRISLAVLVAGAALMALLTWLTLRRALRPIDTLTKTATAIAEGDLDQVAPVTSHDEIGQLARAFNGMTSQLKELIGNLEQRVKERTSALEAASQNVEHRAGQLEAISKVSASIAAVRDLETLLPQVTHVIADYFGFYHVGIFLLDETREFAVLSAANSEGGKRMLERGHRLRVGVQGIVGYVASTGMPRIALDTGLDAVFFDNPDLPQTRSEVALPLLAGRQVIGILDVQSEQPSAFSQDDVQVLSTLASQVSIAIQNARLFEETRRSLAEVRHTFTQYVQSALGQASEETSIGYRLTDASISPLKAPIDRPEIRSALSEGETITTTENGGKDGTTLAVPIKLRDEVIGVLDICLPVQHSWGPDEVDIAQAIAERVAIAVENAALLEETQRRAAKERIIGEITSKISSSVNMRNVLQTAVEELGRAIPGSDIVIQFQNSADDSES